MDAQGSKKNISKKQKVSQVLQNTQKDGTTELVNVTSRVTIDKEVLGMW